MDKPQGEPLRVLIAEDSEDDALLLVRELRRGGYVPEFRRVETRDAVQAALHEVAWELVISDHNMPGLDSGQVLELVHQSGADIPFIIVSGSIGEEVAVEAMRAGAHDYIMKDNLKRLLPAVQRELREAVQRRAHRAAQETIRHLAFHDSLTGLANRLEFERCLQAALQSARERDQGHVLLYIDLDQFKIINDTCGHMAGDELLRRLAEVLNQSVRDSDTLARLGGDEFGILLESCPVEVATKIAEGLLDKVKTFRFGWNGKSFHIGASIGMVTVHRDTPSVSEALSRADLACYAAKELGRNRIHVSSTGDAELARRHGEMQWVVRISHALEEGRLLLYHQRMMPLAASDAACNCELLLRMRDNDGSIVEPDEFVPAAERFNLMPTLDRWVIETVCNRLARGGSDGASARRVDRFFINLSGTTLSSDGLLSFIMNQVRSNGLSPERLGFEITETAAIADFGAAVKLIEDLRAQGFGVALDDFGSGMSSFSYLKSMPVDYIKIDGSFVKRMLDDPMDRAIVAAINGIGHVAGIKTVAESVDTEAIRQRLCDIGIDYGQGYALDRPIAWREDAMARRIGGL